VPTFHEDGVRHSSVALSDEELKKSDVVVIITDHTSVDYQRLVNRAGLIVDTRNATKGKTPGRARIVSLSTSSAPEPAEPRMAASAAGKVVA
jgi:UDP-N-acetyl-D-mannosaminuronate dehydrogenase